MRVPTSASVAVIHNKSNVNSNFAHYLETISISNEASPATHPQQGTGQLEQSSEVDGFFFIADEPSSALGEPCQRPFHHPAACRLGLLAVGSERLLTHASDMWGVSRCGCGRIAGRMIVALVQTAVLGHLLGRLRPISHAGPTRGRQELGVVDVGPSHGGAQGPARRVHAHAACHPFCPRAVGLRPPRSPPIRALPLMASAACHCPSTPPHAGQASTSTAQRGSKRPW